MADTETDREVGLGERDRARPRARARERQSMPAHARERASDTSIRADCCGMFTQQSTVTIADRDSPPHKAACNTRHTG